MPCPDLNGDGVVSVADLAIEGSYLGQTVPPAPAQADMDGDLDVDNDDVAFFSPPLVPQPQWIASCQDKPIGPAGAVGGVTQLAAAAVPDEDSANVSWWLAASAVAGLAVLAAARLVFRDRRL